MSEFHRLSAEKGPRDFAAQRRADVLRNDLTVGVGRMHRNRRTTEARRKLPLLSGLARLPSCISGVHSMASWVSPARGRRMRRRRGRVLSVPWTVSGDPSAIEASGRRRRRVCAAATVAVRSATRRGHGDGHRPQAQRAVQQPIIRTRGIAALAGRQDFFEDSHRAMPRPGSVRHCVACSTWWRAARHCPMRQATWPGSRCPGG